MPLSEVDVSMRNQIYFTSKSYYTCTRNKFAGDKTDQSKDYDIRGQTKTWGRSHAGLSLHDI